MKECFKCKKVKPYSEYYKHKGMKDGHLGKCKSCAKGDTVKYRHDNIEKVREYDRNRPNAEERISINKERIDRYKTEEPDKYKKYVMQKLNWAKKNKHKKNAHNIVARALMNGNITRPLSCEVCGSSSKLQAHHNDYNRPLEVVWLCVPCHAKAHKDIREAERSK